MNMLEVIKSRRSVSKVMQDCVATESIEKILEAGCWAPNHKRTEPWRFSVFMGEGRDKLQSALVEGTKQAHKDLPGDDLALKLAKMENKAYRSPVVIAVWCAVARGKKNPPVWEEYAAVAACIQNMTLAAHSLGLGSIWRSGSLVEYPEIQDLCKVGTDVFDASKGDKIIGFLYLGYPDASATMPKREQPSYADKTTYYT